MITYAVSEFSYGGPPREAFGLLDVEGQQTSFSEKDKHAISAHFFGQRPYPEIIIQLAPVQDSNLRNHDRPADYVNERGTQFWISTIVGNEGQ